MVAMEQDTQAQAPSPNIGRCMVVGPKGCKHNCEGYLYSRFQDGFNLCVCGHTQLTHGVAA